MAGEDDTQALAAAEGTPKSLPISENDLFGVSASHPLTPTETHGRPASPRLASDQREHRWP
jgi:hypothetical protein